MAFRARREKMQEDFPKIPHDEILQQFTAAKLYTELEDRYKAALINLKAYTDRDCAKLVMVICTPQVGKFITPGNTYGFPFIIKTCDNIGIDVYDFTPKVLARDVMEITQTPEDGSWSVAGAKLMADLLDTVLRKYDTQRSSRFIGDQKKPSTFGDLPPNQDETLDDVSTPYHIKSNSQGLRMDYDITFPKKKQTVLVMGGAKVFTPYLSNDAIATAVLQKRHPDKIIINAGMLHYTMDDFETLYKEKARFTEPDVVIVVSDGDDILEEYFSHRNKYARSMRIFAPTPAEEEFYKQLYNSYK